MPKPGRRPPPAWVMGLVNLTFGAYGGLVLVTTPQLLAARHVAEPVIAGITAAAMIPTFAGFLVAPILDVRFSRRSYTIFFGLLTALIAFAALEFFGDLASLSALLVIGFLSANLFYNALGGWIGSVVPAGEESLAGMGFTIGNVVGFGVGAILFITLLRLLPGTAGNAAVGLLIAAPLLLCTWIPAGVAERRGARESFATLFRDIGQLVRRRVVLRTLLLFCLPASSFALTNTLGGLGGDFGASERFVAFVAGIGVTIAGLIGSLIVPRIIGWIAPSPLYLAIGGLGALFTLALIGLPRTPTIFAVALIGENIFQSAAFVVESTITFRSIGENNPLAATQFAVLQAATSFPITYMQAVDGQAYGVNGLTGSLIADAGLSILACAILLPLVLRWREDRPASASAQREAVR